MIFIFYIILLLLIFLCFCFVLDSFEKYIYTKIYQREVDLKIKDALFNELGFSYRETSGGKKFLIIDEFKNTKAIKL